MCYFGNTYWCCWWCWWCWFCLVLVLVLLVLRSCFCLTPPRTRHPSLCSWPTLLNPCPYPPYLYLLPRTLQAFASVNHFHFHLCFTGPECHGGAAPIERSPTTPVVWQLRLACYWFNAIILAVGRFLFFWLVIWLGGLVVWWFNWVV